MIKPNPRKVPSWYKGAAAAQSNMLAAAQLGVRPKQGG